MARQYRLTRVSGGWEIRPDGEGVTLGAMTAAEAARAERRCNNAAERHAPGIAAARDLLRHLERERDKAVLEAARE